MQSPGERQPAPRKADAHERPKRLSSRHWMAIAGVCFLALGKFFCFPDQGKKDSTPTRIPITTPAGQSEDKIRIVIPGTPHTTLSALGK